METILDKLTAYATIRTAQDKKKIPLTELKRMCREQELKGNFREPFCFEKALMKPGLSFICEVKKASPSKGIIAENFPYMEIAHQYEEAGADCISCLTEPKWFLGSDRIFTDIRSEVNVPMIRKDFTVDIYQLYQAKLMGADAVLLICAVLGEKALKEYINICDSLGLSALIEAHDEAELDMAIAAGARIAGVNNRNLKDFSVDTGNCKRLVQKVPDNVIFVAESGIRTSEDTKAISEAGADAVLIGETLMRAPDKKKMLAELRGNL